MRTRHEASPGRSQSASCQEGKLSQALCSIGHRQEEMATGGGAGDSGTSGDPPVRELADLSEASVQAIVEGVTRKLQAANAKGKQKAGEPSGATSGGKSL